MPEAGLPVIILQAVITVFCVSTMFYLVRLDRTRISVLLLTNMTLILFMNLGYLLELISKDLSEVLIGVRLEYVGTSFVYAVGMIFVVNYSGLRFSRILTTAIISWHLLITVLVWTYKFHDLYYSNINLVGGFLSKETGVFYSIESVVISAELLVTLIFAIYDLVKAVKRKADDLRARILVFTGVLMIVIGNIIYSTGITGNYDPIPASEALLAFFFLLAIRDMGIFSGKNLAHNRIIKTLDEPVIIVDNDRKLIEANDRARAVFPALKWAREFSRIKDERLLAVMNGTYTGEIKEGERYYRSDVRPFGEGNEEGGITLLFFDVTKEHEHIEEAKALKEEADSANSTKSRFFYEMSNEIKKPLDQVEEINDVMIRHAEEPSIKEYSSDISSAVKRLKEIVFDIDDLSKIERGELSLNLEPFDSKELLNNVLQIARPLMEEKGLEFKTTITEPFPERLVGDHLRLWQVMNNLLSNAAKYTDEGYVSFKLLSEKLPEENGETYYLISVAIEDSGIGIRKADRDSLFEKFRRIEEQRNHEVEGSGLGLSLAAEYLALMGSGIKVESEYGKGSRFSFSVKLKEAQNVSEIED